MGSNLEREALLPDSRRPERKNGFRESEVILKSCINKIERIWVSQDGTANINRMSLRKKARLNS